MQQEYITKEYLNQTLTEHFDNFAKIVKAGFDEVHRKFDEIDKKFTQVDDQLNRLESKVDEIDIKLNYKTDKFEMEALEKRLDRHIKSHN